MLRKRIGNIIFAAFLILASVYFGWLAEGFETTGLLATSGLPSKFFPQLMLGCSAICAGIVIWHYVVRDQEQEFVFVTSSDARRGALMLLVSIISYFIWRELGFVPMVVVFGPLSLLAMGIKQIGIYVIVWALSALIWVIFTFVLGVQLV